MLYLNKLLKILNEDPLIFKDENLVTTLGLSLSHIKNLKKYALENELITQSKQEYFLTPKGNKYLNSDNSDKKYSPIFQNINTEYLKEEKIPSILTKAIRNLAKYYIENQVLKNNSLEESLNKDINNCNDLFAELEQKLLNSQRNLLNEFYENHYQKGLTKSLISILLLKILVKNSDCIAIYEKSQFQLNFDTLMFDRMIACPQNFEIQKTEMPDEILLEDLSKIILNKKSNNILEITKGLYKSFKQLDKYTMNTQNLSPKTLRLRNVIINAKDPITLFERDIPKVLSGNLLKNCSKNFINDFKLSVNELYDCRKNLLKELKKFFLESFNSKTKEDLAKRFLLIEEYVNEKELKILYNNVKEIDATDELWINRIATFINKHRVPKDWSDEDFADFKIKTKELALKFFALESTVGNYENIMSKKFQVLFNNFLELEKTEQILFIRKIVNL